MSHDEARLLHLGGLDLIHPAYDAPVAPGFDPSLGVESQATREREAHPQLGPQFVRYVVERFDAQDALMRRALAKWSEKPTTTVFVASMQTSATGGISRNLSPNAILYEPAPGWTFALHRLTIFNAGNTLGAPFTAAGSWWELRVNDELIEGSSMISGQGQLPVTVRWGTRDAPHVRDGEILSLFMSGGPVSQVVTCKGQGTLVREIEA